METVEHFTPAPAKVQQKVDCTALSNTLLNRKTGKAVVATMGSIPGTPNAAGVLPPAVIREDHLVGNYVPLLSALSEPSERNPDVNCLYMGEVPPELWLVNPAGEAVHVQWPLEACSGAKPAVSEALANLTVGTSVHLPWPVPS